MTGSAVAMSAETEQEPVPPADYDGWYSALVSFVFHFCLMLAISLFSGILAARDKLPPAVDVVHVTDAATRGMDDVEGVTGQEQLESITSDPLPEMPLSAQPAEQLNQVRPVETPAIDVSTNDVQSEVRDQVRQAQQAAAAARAAASQLSENLGGTPSGSTSAGNQGRAGRAQRWILRFNTSNPKDHLQQLHGLGAQIAFPAEGDKYRYFSNLSGTPTSTLRDLTGENRIFWIDDDTSTILGLTRELGIPPSSIMIAFLPTSLEQKMLRLELARASERGVTEESGVAQTVFECVRRGGSYDVVVVDQTLAGR